MSCNPHYKVAIALAIIGLWLPVAAWATFVEAPHPPAPQVLYNGGPLLTNPKFLPITWSGDPLQSGLDDFTKRLGVSDYWHAVTSEYGIGPASQATPVHLTEAAPASIIDDFANSTDTTTIQGWLADKLDGTHPEFGAPDSTTIYALFYPATTTVFAFGSAGCVYWGAYHYLLYLPSGQPIVYAVMPRCDDGPPFTPLDSVTLPTSHEFVEAVTDPAVGAGYDGTDAEHSLWGWETSELADMCEWLGHYPGSDFTLSNPGYRLPGSGYFVQRTWSNAAAAAGHDPCQPTLPGQAYFNSAPVLPQAVPAVGSVNTGIVIAPGQTKNVELDLFSDAPSNNWTYAAYDLPTFLATGAPPELAFSFDRSGGRNGDKVKMTITVRNANAAQTSPFIVVSGPADSTGHLASGEAYWVGVVDTQPTAPLEGSYRFVSVDGHGGQAAQLWGINADRQVAGLEYSDANRPPPSQLAVLFEYDVNNAGSALFGNDRSPSEVAVPNMHFTKLNKVNGDGLAAGGYMDSNGLVHAMLYDSARGSTLLMPDAAPGFFNLAEAANSKRRVLGLCLGCAPDYTVDGWLWDSRAGYSFFDVPGASFTAPEDLRDDDAIVGVAGLNPEGLVPDGAVGFMMRGSTTTIISMPGALYSGSAGINRHGDIVGAYAGPSLDAPHTVGVYGYLLHDGVVSTVSPPGATRTYVNSINDQGDLAGTYWDAVGLAHGFVMLRRDPAENPEGQELADGACAGVPLGSSFEDRHQQLAPFHRHDGLITNRLVQSAKRLGAPGSVRWPSQTPSR